MKQRKKKERDAQTASRSVVVNLRDDNNLQSHKRTNS